MNQKERQFITTVLTHYKQNGRHKLPWRKTKNPYYIAISEVMLQQTQVPRVIEKYKLFIRYFPTLQSLAQASLGEVLSLWVGLGYNRRAKFLKQMAEEIVLKHKGIFPKTIAGLESLPGIGPYTARAIITFAFNQPSIFVETNIRTVYFHHFFPNATHKISDSTLLPLIEKTIHKENPRLWYWALMDYGSHLKASGVRNIAKSTHYIKQKPFIGSIRKVRGAIIRSLVGGKKTKQELSLVCEDKEQFEKALLGLLQEVLIKKVGKYYTLM